MSLRTGRTVSVTSIIPRGVISIFTVEQDKVMMEFLSQSVSSFHSPLCSDGDAESQAKGRAWLCLACPFLMYVWPVEAYEQQARKTASDPLRSHGLSLRNPKKLHTSPLGTINRCHLSPRLSYRLIPFGAPEVGGVVGLMGDTKGGGGRTKSPKAKHHLPRRAGLSLQ